MRTSAYLLFVLVAQYAWPVTSQYVHRRSLFNLNLDDNLISIGGQDCPYHVAVMSDGPDENGTPSDELTGVESDVTIETCTPEYRSLPEHTMCIKDSPKVLFSGVTEEDKRIIVDDHNMYRGNSYPEAEDMQKVVWDKSLATIAQKWALQCIVGHDSGRSRNIPGWGVYTGQNAAGGFMTWSAAVRGWHNEVEEYQYGRDPDDYVTSKDGVGHYIQMIQNTTVLVGCGYAECVDSTYRRFYICNYAGGNAGRPANPYTNGTRCKKCPDHCVDGLCDCKGKFCFNGGKIDVTSCTCTCKSLYIGDTCMDLNCPKKDMWYCGKVFHPEHCVKYGDLKFNCPYMCGVCHEKCYKYGSRGRDRGDCESKGGFYGCSDCASFAVRDKHCPVMCGVCDAPCDGMECLNGGTLRPETCDCNCLANYNGTHCENFTCPATDVDLCSLRFEPDECDKPEAISKCPYYCGVCEEVLPCDGKVCLNRGKLDTESCNCLCKEKYEGDTCGTFLCPEEDLRRCQNIVKADCETPRTADICPYFCGRCKPDYTTPPPTTPFQADRTVEPGVFVSRHGCMFSGERPPEDTCLSYGNNGLDLDVCESQGGVIGCEDCGTADVNQQCPVMCAVCDPPCQGKTCKNGGVLHTRRCFCRCSNRYIGNRCQDVFCPAQEDVACRNHTVAECSLVENLAEDCPYLCGICEQMTVLLPGAEKQGEKSLEEVAELPVFISGHGCAFFGDRPSPDRCQVKGIRGFDNPLCETENVGCSLCGAWEVINACPVLCGACDPPCGNKTCLNGGLLKIDGSCGCKCDTFYAGDNCDTLACPAKERSNCRKMTPADCTLDPMLWKSCPFLCGLCTPPTTTPAPVFVSRHGCQFKGQRLSPASCAKKGQNGFDLEVCQTSGGSLGCEECETASRHCPVMCGACDPPCGSKECLNGGSLKVDGSCDCKCLKFYEGNLCETLICPEKDPPSCRQASPGDCVNNGLPNCPYLCELCVAPTTTTAEPTTLPLFISDHGCEFLGFRLEQSQCKSRGRKGHDDFRCETYSGQYGCSDCSLLNIEHFCPVMCGLCDNPCGEKRCENDGTLAVDGSCSCKCPNIFTGDRCETVVCPKTDKKLCADLTAEDCKTSKTARSNCPYMCGMCSLPVFVSALGCKYIGERPTTKKCLKLGDKGLDSSICVTEGGEYGCDECLSVAEECPVMCGLCDGKMDYCTAPCDGMSCLNGGKLNTNKCVCSCPANFKGDRCETDICGDKVCQNEGVLKVDGSCQCKCSALHQGEFCETLVCPTKDKFKCDSKTVNDCQIDSELWQDCPILCGVCKPPTFVSEYGCTYIGERPVVSKCLKLGNKGLDSSTCATEGGESGCGDCVNVGKTCPVMCGLCDAPCDGMRCTNGGKLNTMKCSCTCPANFKGDRCETDICGDKTCQNGGELKVDGSCQCKCSALHQGEFCETLVCPEKDMFKCRSKTENDCQLVANLWESCPLLCGVCEPPKFKSEFGCTFIGERPPPSKCLKMGKKGLDSPICGTNGGESGCADCVTLGETCPVMCGLCEAPCDGLTCLNEGKLNTGKCLCTCPKNFKGNRCEIDICGGKLCQNGGVLKVDGSCQCKCSALHQGEVCETLVCPGKDLFKCRNKTENDCQLEANLWESCPILCGVCEPPKFKSEFGCTYIGERPQPSRCLKMGNKGLDSSTCITQGGESGCADCVTMGETCPVMCGLCDAPCDGLKCLNGGKLNTMKCLCACAKNFKGDRCETNICGDKVCQNGGLLKVDGSCQCKCSALHQGEFCETLVCPTEDKFKCSGKTTKDCQLEGKLWEACPILCGVCEAPVFVSDFGCTFVGERPASSTCSKMGKKGLDSPTCATEGGEFGCADCVTLGKTCPVMCGLCDAPCDGLRCVNGGKLNTLKCVCTCAANFKGDRCEIDICEGKTCQNGGLLKVDGSCQCKCSALHQGKFCERLVCPEKDKFKCGSKTSNDCQLSAKLWESCPILCGICEPPAPPKFVSEFGCTYVGDRPTSSKCSKLGNRGLDSSICATEGGKSGCADCVTIGEKCPVMCGLCDAPCGGKRCLNGGNLNRSGCVCKCLSNFHGDICEDMSCPRKDFWKCGKNPYVESSCDSDPKTASKCPYLCGLCPVRTR